MPSSARFDNFVLGAFPVRRALAVLAAVLFLLADELGAHIVKIYFFFAFG